MVDVIIASLKDDAIQVERIGHVKSDLEINLPTIHEKFFLITGDKEEVKGELERLISKATQQKKELVEKIDDLEKSIAYLQAYYNKLV